MQWGVHAPQHKLVDMRFNCSQTQAQAYTLTLCVIHVDVVVQLATELEHHDHYDRR